MDLPNDMKNKREMTVDNGEVVKNLTLDEILAQSFIFFLAGFMTSSSNMGFALYELAKNHPIQDKDKAKVKEVLKKNNQGDQE